MPSPSTSARLDSPLPRQRWTMLVAWWEAWKNHAPDAWAQFDAQGIPVNAVDDDGWTPIRWALHAKNMTVMERLIERGADLTVTSRENGTLVEQAFTERKPDMALRLLNAGSPLTTTDGTLIRWVHEAITWNHADLLNALLVHPDLPRDHRTWCDRNGRTELHRLIMNNQLPTGQRAAWIPPLVARGNPINAYDPDGYTALHLVIQRGRAEDLALLVPLMDAGASLSMHVNDGSDLDAVGLAMQQGNLDARVVLETHALTRALPGEPPAFPSAPNAQLRPPRPRL